jgi:hypothetical protein
MEESTMNNIHATTLRTNSHRVEARMEAAAAIWFAMKWRGLTLHLQYTEHGPRWSLSDAQRVPASVARMVIGYTDVVDVGDTLLTGTLSQTWRFAAVCECHSITFYEVMI